MYRHMCMYRHKCMYGRTSTSEREEAMVSVMLGLGLEMERLKPSTGDKEGGEPCCRVTVTTTTTTNIVKESCDLYC